MEETLCRQGVTLEFYVESVGPSRVYEIVYFLHDMVTPRVLIPSIKPLNTDLDPCRPIVIVVLLQLKVVVGKVGDIGSLSRSLLTIDRR